MFGLGLALASCGQGDRAGEQQSGAKITHARAPESGGIPCARGEGALAPDCTIDRTPTQDGVILTIHHPDGGFRRLKIARDGRGVIAADGAQPAKVTVTGAHEIEVAIGGDRYRLPATVGGASGAR